METNLVQPCKSAPERHHSGDYDKDSSPISLRHVSVKVRWYANSTSTRPQTHVMLLHSNGGRISLKKSHKIILLIIGILIMLAVIAFVLKSAYRLGQQDALREENKQTNQRAK